MTTTALPTTGLDVIEALDFDPDVACEAARGADCDRPAAWYWCFSCDCRGPVAFCLLHDAATTRVLANFPDGGICPICSQDVHGTRLGPVRTP